MRNIARPDSGLRRHFPVLPCSQSPRILILVQAPGLRASGHTSLHKETNCIVYHPNWVVSESKTVAISNIREITVSSRDSPTQTWTQAHLVIPFTSLFASWDPASTSPTLSPSGP